MSLADAKPGDLIYFPLYSLHKVERVTPKSLVVNGKFVDKETGRIRGDPTRACVRPATPQDIQDTQWFEESKRLSNIADDIAKVFREHPFWSHRARPLDAKEIATLRTCLEEMKESLDKCPEKTT